MQSEACLLGDSVVGSGRRRLLEEDAHHMTAPERPVRLCSAENVTVGYAPRSTGHHCAQTESTVTGHYNVGCSVLSVARRWATLSGAVLTVSRMVSEESEFGATRSGKSPSVRLSFKETMDPAGTGPPCSVQISDVKRPLRWPAGACASTTGRPESRHAVLVMGCSARIPCGPGGRPCTVPGTLGQGPRQSPKQKQCCMPHVRGRRAFQASP